MRRALWALAVGLGIAAATFSTTWALLFHRPAPTIDGYYRLLGLHERAEVVRDVFGIPRIYARDLHDLFFLQGYVTAQDRYGQMETKRGLSLRPSDRRSLDGDLERAFSEAPAAVRDPLEAYAAGVNKFVEQHRAARALPGELLLEGRRPERWTARDSVSILAGYLARIDAGSRCVAIGPDRSAKGRPLLAADLYVDEMRPRQGEPDAGLHEIGLDGGGVRAVGVAIPGVPGIVAGHNGWIAWTLGVGSRSHDAVSTLASTLRALEGRRISDAAVPLPCAADVYGGRRGDETADSGKVDLESMRRALGPTRHTVGARLLVDLADVDTSRSAVSRGASAHRSSSHYDDQAPLWKVGQTHRLPFTRGAVGRTDGELVFRAR
jgi:acyl-homoserine lactone acylase PvdQ